MSVRTGMYHFEVQVSRTAMYRVRYVLVRTSTYRHVLPCTRCTGFQMPGLRVTSFLFVSCRSLTSFPTLHSASSLGTLSPRASNQSRRHHVPSLHRGHGLSATLVTSLGPGRHGSRDNTSSCAARLLAHRAPATGPALAQRIPPGSGAYHRPTPFRDRSRQGATPGYSRLRLP